jgi:quercetin dioxygenase-like cupin family protein
MIIRGQDAPTDPAEPGVTRQVLAYDETLMMVRVTFAAGAVGYIHSHPHRQVTFVERGRFRFTLDGRETELTAGDSWFVAPDLPHGVVALEAGALIDVFTPARAEFVAGR